jgi:hypothetical protein
MSAPSKAHLSALRAAPPVRGSAILWRGPSALDGQPIVVIATGIPTAKPRTNSNGRSTNRKTGKMAQIWIFRDDMTPLAATMSGADASVCGGCALRPLMAKLAGLPTTGPRKQVCYLTMQLRAGRGPSTVHKAFRAGRYRDATSADVEALGRGAIRWGSYGDPLAIPMDALARHPFLVPLVRAERRTGYTHRWSELDGATAAWAQTWLMASCETEAQALAAQAKGWRTFRSRAKGAPLLPGERGCPAAKENGEKLTCATCRQCDGTERGARRPSFSLRLH